MWDLFFCVLALLSPSMAVTVAKIPSNNNTNTYQIIEEISDIPDNRTLAPIDPTYGINVPLNFGNNALISDNNTNEPTEYTPIINPYEITDNQSNKTNGTYEVTENKPETEQNNKNEKNNKTDKINLKKNSFSILHIQGEFDNKDKVSNNKVGFKGFLDGLRSYLFNVKKGLVDGLYNWYHKDEAKKEIDKFYRSFNNDDENTGSDDDDVRNWIHRDEVQKEINDFYKSFNEESDGEDQDGGDKGDDEKTNEEEPSDEESNDEESNDGYDDGIDVRFGEQHSNEYDDDYSHHHRKHRKFGGCH